MVRLSWHSYNGETEQVLKTDDARVIFSVLRAAVLNQKISLPKIKREIHWLFLQV